MRNKQKYIKLGMLAKPVKIQTPVLPDGGFKMSKLQKELLMSDEIDTVNVERGFGKSGYMSKSNYIDFLKLQAKFEGKSVDHISNKLPLKEQKKRLLDALFPKDPPKWVLIKHFPGKKWAKYSTRKVKDRIELKYKMKKGKQGGGLLIIEDFNQYATGLAKKEGMMEPLTSNKYYGKGIGQIAQDAIDMERGLKRLTRDKVGMRQIKPNEKL